MDKVKEHEFFKLRWMLDHGYTLEDLMDALEAMRAESPGVPLNHLFDHWQFDVGFGSEIWPCYDEWKECEGQEDEICDATFVSVWDGGYDVRTPCKVNMRTGEVFDIGLSDSSGDVLDAEYVEFADGRQIEACNAFSDEWAMNGDRLCWYT